MSYFLKLPAFLKFLQSVYFCTYSQIPNPIKSILIASVILLIIGIDLF